MKVLGLIVEYNPFHNGHIYHIQKAKEITQCDYCIAVMSSSFVQRGEPAIIDKWTRAQIAIDYGIDLLIELPFVYAVQSADYFAKGAIDLLHAIGVTDICFGSEDGKIQTFVDIATTIENHHEQYNTLVKEAMQKGTRYPDACNYALKTILNHEIKTPNDLLGLSYVKEIVSHHYSITPHCLKRTNHYHDTQIQNIASATAIRHAIFNHQDFANSLPYHNYYNNDLYHLDAFFPYLKYQLLISSPSQIKQYHLVEEGLENVLCQAIQDVSSMEELIQALSSKRYTRPRIQRMLIHILMKNTKEDIQNAMNIDYLRVLGMNQKGRKYLNKIKKTCPYHLVTRFSSYQHPALDIEFKATKLLSLISQDSQSTTKKEYQGFPYQKLNSK